jgi:hypothetical protein
MALPAEVTDTVSPPLSATPAGVTSFHFAAAGVREKSSQNVFRGWPFCPMATTTQEPVGVVSAAANGTRRVGTGVLAAAGAPPPAT